jgi:hypothetical protein
MGREEVKKAQAAQELAETATSNTGHDDANQSQTDQLRAYAPASRAMDPASPEGDDDYFDDGEYDDLDDDDESPVAQVARDMHQESVAKKTADLGAEDRKLSAGDAEGKESGEVTSGGENAISATVVDSVVNEINRIAWDTVERGQLEIGEYVFQVAFKGEIKDVMSKNAYKTQTLKAISEHPRLMVDRRRIGSWVKAAAFKADLEGELVDCDKLTVGKLTALLTLGDKYKVQRKELAARANEEGLSVRDILDAVEGLKGAKKEDKSKGLLRKIAAPLALLVDEKTKADLSDKVYLEEKLQSGDRLDMVKAIDEITAKLDESSGFLRTVKKNLVRIELADHDLSEA